MILFSHKQRVKCMQCLFSTLTLSTLSMTHKHMLYPALKPECCDDMKTPNHLHAVQLLLDSAPSHPPPVYLPKSFCFPLFCTHTQYGSHTFSFLSFPSSICISLMSEPCNENCHVLLFKIVLAIHGLVIPATKTFISNRTFFLWTYHKPTEPWTKNPLQLCTCNYTPVCVHFGITATLHLCCPFNCSQQQTITIRFSGQQLQ